MPRQAKKEDVISDQHQVPGPEILIQPSSGVGHDDEPRTQGLHHPDRQRQSVERNPLVEMDPPLKHRHRDLLQRTQDQPSGVSGNGRAGKVRDLLVGDDGRIVHRIRQRSQPRTGDHPDLGSREWPLPNLGGDGLYRVAIVRHPRLSPFALRPQACSGDCFAPSQAIPSPPDGRDGASRRGSPAPARAVSRRSPPPWPWREGGPSRRPRAVARS